MRHESGETSNTGVLGPATFGRVMVAVDSSETSQWALQVGASLASRLGAEIAMLHVVDLAKGFAPELEIVDDRVLAELRVAGTQLLDHAACEMPAGLSVQTFMREGHPATEIVAAAVNWRADMLVLGTHARGVIARFFLGSTAQAVVREAHCPVLTVGHQPKSSRSLPDSAIDEAAIRVLQI